jgi:hypothetical protein
MALPITDLVAGIFKPAVELIDEMHTSKEEKLEAKARLIEAEAAAVTTAIEYERGVLEAKARVITAEASSEHLLTAVWRPITMLVLMFMVVCYWFGIIDPSDRLSEKTISDVFLLIQIGIGGYIASRGAEKIVAAVKK